MKAGLVHGQKYTGFPEAIKAIITQSKRFFFITLKLL
jgi:hypothetical protein